MRSEFVPRINGSGNIVSRAQQAGVTPDFIMANNQHVPACAEALLFGGKDSKSLVVFIPSDGDFTSKKNELLQKFYNANATVPESLYDALAEAELQCLTYRRITWIRAVAVMLNHTLIHPASLSGELIKTGSAFAHPYAWRYLTESTPMPDLNIYGEWSYTGTAVGSTVAYLGVHVQPQDATKQLVTFAKFGHYNSSSFAPVDERWPTYYGNAYYQERYLDFDGRWSASYPKKYIEDENCTRAYFNAQMGHIQDEDYPEKSVSAVFLVDGTNAFSSYELDLPYEYLTKYNIFRFFQAYSAYNLNCGWGLDLASPFKRDSAVELGWTSWGNLKNWVDTSVRDAGSGMWTLWDEIFQHIDARVIGEYNTTHATGKALILDVPEIYDETLISSSQQSLDAYNDDNIGELVDDGSTTPIVAYKRQRTTAQSSDGYDCITVENRDSLAFDTILDSFGLHARDVDATISLKTTFPATAIWDSLETSKKLELLQAYANATILDGVVTILGSDLVPPDVRVEIKGGVGESLGEMYFPDGTTYLNIAQIIAAMGLSLDSTTVSLIADILRRGISLTFKLNEGLSGPGGGIYKAFIFGPGSITGDPTNEWLDV